MPNQQGNQSNKKNWVKTPLKPKEILVEVEQRQIEIKSNGFLIGIDVKVYYKDSNIPVKNVNVELRERGIYLTHSSTQNSGYSHMGHIFDLSNANSILTLDVLVEGYSIRKPIQISFPELPKPIVPTEPNPEELIFWQSETPEQELVLSVDLEMENGIACADKIVEFRVRGKRYNKRTNAQGSADLKIDKNIRPKKDESIPVSVKVSGIEDPVELSMWGKITKYTAPKKFSKRWWKSNNALSYFALRLSVILLIYILFQIGFQIFGYYDPILLPTRTELTKEEIKYNEIRRPEDQITLPQSSKENKQSFPLGTVVIFTCFIIVSVIYVPFAYREEIEAELKEQFRKKSFFRSTKERDPFLEDMYKKFGILATARKKREEVIPVISPVNGATFVSAPAPPSQPTVNTASPISSAASADAREKKFLWKIAGIEVFSETFVDLVIPILTKLLIKKAK